MRSLVIVQAIKETITSIIHKHVKVPTLLITRCTTNLYPGVEQTCTIAPNLKPINLNNFKAILLLLNSIPTFPSTLLL